MTPDEFRNALNTQGEAELVARCLDDARTPYVFDSEDGSWLAFRQEISTELATHISRIRVVGSGLFGFSLKPSNNFRQFQDTSDVDIVVVDENLFDTLWIDLLTAAYPRPPVQGGGSVRERQKALYTGWIVPGDIGFDLRIEGEKVRPALEFKSRWFQTFKKASVHVSRPHEDVSARLYRTWSHVEMYHLHSLRALRNSMEQ